MAKKKQQQNTDPKAQTLARIKRTEAYAEQVRKLFAATVNEILALNRTMPTLNEGEMFSFAGESLKKQKEVERLLRQLHAVATMAIQKGIRLEWAQANAECDRLVQSCFGKRALNTPQFSAWTQRNEAAMAAFIARSERGLNLSERVWKSCRQLRDEMEVAITVAVGDGTSAATMSRRVRQYLNDPDLMFRRFRYRMTDKDGNPKVDEHGKPVYGLKWKKKITKEDGSVGWIDYDKDSYHDQWTGPGYYKSSAQNAMRVARTETNIAYRRADNERWKQMDFVLGQRVQLSRSHPKKDICDKLAGDYPPDFVFDGWHPQCFCFVTPILVDEDEIVKMNEAMLNGEEYRPRGKRITDYPDGFKEWVRENEDKLLDAHKAGKDPYFVRNNFADVQNILNPKKQLTPLEIAEQRHAARTPEQEEAIRLRWQERQAQREAERLAEEQERKRIAQINTTANNVLGVAKSRFADFGIDTSALDIAMQSGDSNLIKAETRALAKILSEKQQHIKQQAQSVIDKAALFKDFEGSTDVASLEALKKTGNLSAIHAQSLALETQIKDLSAQLHAMSSVIPNAQTLSQTHTVSDIREAHDELDSVLNKWLKKYGYTSIDSAPLEHLRNKLDFELSSPTINYTHKDIIKQALTEQIQRVEQKIAWDNLIAKAASLRVFKTRSAIYKTYLTQIDAAIANKDLTALQKSVADAETQKMKLVTAQVKRKGDTGGALNKEYKGSVDGKDISSGIDVSTMTSEDPYNSRSFTNNIARMQGFDAPAKLVSEEEFVLLEKACGEVFYRTVNSTKFKGKSMTSQEFASQLYVAELLELNGPGGRVYGDGMYVATSAWNGRTLSALSDSNKKHAYRSSVCYGHGSHTISEMTFVRKPKIIKQTDLQRMWSRLDKDVQRKFGFNENTYACALGYDAMYCDGPNYMVIWNRSIIAVKKQ